MGRSLYNVRPKSGWTPPMPHLYARCPCGPPNEGVASSEITIFVMVSSMRNGTNRIQLYIGLFFLYGADNDVLLSFLAVTPTLGSSSILQSSFFNGHAIYGCFAMSYKTFGWTYFKPKPRNPLCRNEVH